MKDPSSAEAQPPESSTMTRLSNGFRAHLQGVGLHDLVMLQNLVRASGVFVVLSGERTGTLHFSRGQLLHAETAELSGDAAVMEILSWREGEFINSERTPGERSTVTTPVDGLLLRLAPEEEVRPSEPPLTTSTGVRRRIEGPPPFRTTQPGTGALGASSMAGGVPTAQHARGYFDPVPQVPSAPPPRRLAPAATPGLAVSAKTPTRAADARMGVINVLVGPQGNLLDGNGLDPEALGPRVAYIARLTDLIGDAMGAGDTRTIKVRANNSDLLVRRHGDGHVSASLGPADLSSDAPPSSSPPTPSVKLI